MEESMGGLFGDSSTGKEDPFDSYRGLANVSADDETFRLDNSKIRGRKYLPENSDNLEADHGLDDLFTDIRKEIGEDYGLTTVAMLYRELAENAENEGFVNGKQVYSVLEKLESGTDELDYLRP